MIPRVVEAQYVRDYVIWIKFQDGVDGEVDLEDELWGEVFEPLRDQKMFQTVRVHPDLHTLVWSNDADFAPEFLYERVKVAV